jgi:cytochrome c biogenesis protein CcmG, thiol:disulfide interchange protein DsbE
MPKISPLMALPPLVFLGMAALFMTGLGRENPNALPSTFVGRVSPVLEVEPLGDLAPLTDAMLRAPGVKLVNFWASWCAPCRVEHPNLQKMADMGIPIYGINYKDTPINGLRFLEELGNPFRASGQDQNGRQAIEWGVYGIPETFVINGKGRITLRFAGPITGRMLEERILPAIEAARAE